MQRSRDHILGVYVLGCRWSSLHEVVCQFKFWSEMPVGDLNVGGDSKRLDKCPETG